MAQNSVQIVFCIQFFIVLSFGFRDVEIETIEDYICTQRFKGCRIDYKERSCVEKEVVGCWNPFPYSDMNECVQDFYGHGNICDQKPCLNNGICSPVTNEITGRTFKCECAHTGFYGHQCERKCPKLLPRKDPSFIPCLEI